MRTQSSRAEFIPLTLNLARLSSRAIQRRATVQKQLFSIPKGYPFNAKAVVPMKGLQFFVDVPLGRMFQIFLAF